MTLIVSLIIIATIGFIAQRIGICLIKGVGQALDGKPALLMAILMSGCWLWVYFLVSSQMGWRNEIPRHAFHPIFFVGGLLFGIGAGINQGCSVSTMNRFTKGEVSMLLTMVGWAIGWCIWMSISMHSVATNNFYQKTPQLSDLTVLLLFIPALLITVQRLIFKPQQRGLWFGIMAFGLLATVLFLLQSDWPPSRLIQDTGDVIFNPHVTEWPSPIRYLLLLGLFAGMWLAAVLAHQFHYRGLTLKKFLRHMPAGCLMGFGGASALGGNDSHLLLGLPTLSFASIAAVIGMLAGIAIERWCFHRYFSKTSIKI